MRLLGLGKATEAHSRVMHSPIETKSFAELLFVVLPFYSCGFQRHTIFNATGTIHQKWRGLVSEQSQSGQSAARLF
jgi:hypothetical protein